MKISDEVRFLEEAYDVLNEKYFESALQKVAITIQSTPKAHGHFTPWDSWIEGSEMMKLKEINLGAESLKRPVSEIIATLLHEMVHYYCHINGIKDTSRNNTYHNKRFKVESEKRGLIIYKAPVIGYSVTKPSEALCNLVKDQGWSEKIKLFRNRRDISLSTVGGEDDNEGKKNMKKKSSTRKYICPICGMSVRATRDVKIACVECGNALMIKE